ncbi:MAG TPA: hypothetical protein DCR46_01865 [Cytophagales bacterium]|nr:hypothetical protein [Cytophagales bacterium]
MKKIYLLSFFVTAFAAKAQVKIGYALGLKGEAILTTMQTDVAKRSYSMGFGNGFGFFARLKTGRLYFQPEFKYANQTTYQKDTDKNKVSFTSFDVPVLLGGYVFKSKNGSVRLFVGPELIFFNSFKNDGEDLFNPRNSSSIRSGTGSFVLGTGVDFKRISVDLRYKMGMNSVKRKTTSSPNETIQQIVLSVGYKLLYKED